MKFFWFCLLFNAALILKALYELQAAALKGTLFTDQLNALLGVAGFLLLLSVGGWMLRNLQQGIIANVVVSVPFGLMLAYGVFAGTVMVLFHGRWN